MLPVAAVAGGGGPVYTRIALEPEEAALPALPRAASMAGGATDEADAMAFAEPWTFVDDFDGREATHAPSGPSALVAGRAAAGVGAEPAESAAGAAAPPRGGGVTTAREGGVTTRRPNQKGPHPKGYRKRFKNK